jgi:hypothetical protein
VNTSGSISSGPNTGLVYVTSLDTSGSSFSYELNPGITNSSDPFYQHQYGACGIPSASMIANAVIAHEAGPQNSHWAEGATQLALANPGPVAEPVVGTTPSSIVSSLVGQLTPMFNAVAQAASVEPSVNLPAGINYPPYQTCPGH